MNINTYAGELPLAQTTLFISFSSTFFAFPVASKILLITSISFSSNSFSSKHTPVIPSPIIAGVLGMLLTILPAFNFSFNWVIVNPGAREIITLSLSKLSFISSITFSNIWGFIAKIMYFDFSTTSELDMA